ncbi:MAG: FAD-dependent monooxygenase [Paracoccaceae bacterium]
MQYHLNGFRPGDPNQTEAIAQCNTDIADVLIVGCGPAGLTLAAQLAQFPDIKTVIVDRKPGPLIMGQADGIACRSMEMFEAFGFAHKVAREAYWVNEVAFWTPDPTGQGLHRADRIQDVEDDLSEMPHTILSQARVHDFFLDHMRQAPTRLEPRYGLELVSLDRPDDPGLPLTARFCQTDEPHLSETIQARYVVGCDGARSQVRKSLDLTLKGDSARQLWGVMDVLAVTNFPDIRLKCAIQSADQGSLLIIPREGGYLTRMYIELDALSETERAANRAVTSQMLIAQAQEILAPFDLNVAEVAWWSAYEIGQRVCDTFDDVPLTTHGTQTPRVFIAGDACHTHSPKAGQGMNVSMADTFNLGWKLAAVLRGQSAPTLLNTYSQERRAKAKELIDFDRDMARLFSARPKAKAENDQFQIYFKKHGRYTAGVETRYDPSVLTGSSQHQALAQGLKIGMRFHSAPVIRMADAKPMQLGHVLKADGRWRLIAFAPSQDVGVEHGTMFDLCAAITNIVARYTPTGSDIDSVIDMRAVFQISHHKMDIGQLHPMLRPQKGQHGLVDYEKVFCADVSEKADIFEKRGIDRTNGAMVIVRPDQFVANVLPLTDFAALSSFFEGVMVPLVSCR